MSGAYVTFLYYGVDASLILCEIRVRTRPPSQSLEQPSPATRHDDALKAFPFGGKEQTNNVESLPLRAVIVAVALVVISHPSLSACGVVEKRNPHVRSTLQ